MMNVAVTVDIRHMRTDIEMMATVIYTSVRDVDKQIDLDLTAIELQLHRAFLDACSNIANGGAQAPIVFEYHLCDLLPMHAKYVLPHADRTQWLSLKFTELVWKLYYNLAPGVQYILSAGHWVDRMDIHYMNTSELVQVVIQGAPDSHYLES